MMPVDLMTTKPTEPVWGRSVLNLILVVCGNLDFGASGVNIAEEASRIFTEATSRGYRVGGERYVKGVAAAAVWLGIILRSSQRLSQNRVAAASYTDVATLRKRYYELALCLDNRGDTSKFTKFDPKRVPPDRHPKPQPSVDQPQAATTRHYEGLPPSGDTIGANRAR